MYLLKWKNLLFLAGFYLLFLCATVLADAPIIVDHDCTDLNKIPNSAIEQAKTSLHIAYGHTSHGSQLTTGMNGLVGFINGGGLSLNLPENIFAWNNGGSDGALDLHDYAMGGDCGDYPNWVNYTIDYLGEPNPDTGTGTTNPDVNVIIWSWCGEVSGKYANGTLDDQYLTPMSQLEIGYPGVDFVYMTGHVDHWNDANNKAANQMIRDYCYANYKILYDFADIDSHDPDGTFYEFPSDNCDYYASAAGAKLGNWATAWQGSHTEGVDWYNCSSAHSQPLNANQKAYAAWWLWARLAGWDGLKYKTIHVDPDVPGDSEATPPRYTSIQTAINNNIGTDCHLKIRRTICDEDVTNNGTAVTVLEGGWNETFKTCAGCSTIQGRLTIADGSFIIKNIILQ